MTSRRDEEEARKANWAVWLPTIATVIGSAIWFFLSAILDSLGRILGSSN